MPRTWVLVVSTALATLALRELTSSSPIATPRQPAPAARSREVDDLRQAVAQLRVEVARVPAPSHDITPAPVLDAVPPQQRDDIMARAHSRIASAISRGVWTPADDMAVLGDIGVLADDDRRALMLDVHQAITSGRMRPVPMTATEGDAR